MSDQDKEAELVEIARRIQAAPPSVRVGATGILLPDRLKFDDDGTGPSTQPVSDELRALQPSWPTFIGKRIVWNDDPDLVGLIYAV